MTHPQVVPVLGITQRSGTHWLADLLACHPDCRPALRRPGLRDAGWEDLLLEQAPLLVRYAAAVRSRWDAGFRHDHALEDALLARLGEATLAFVASVEPDGGATRATPATGAACGAATGAATHVVTRSPTVEGLELAGRLWPGTPVVVLVRDARAVVASALASFGGSAERWIRVWREGARTILRARSADRAGQLLVVRYEDLCHDLAGTMTRVLDHVGLDPGCFDAGAAGRLAVRGSSETAREAGGLHWQPVTPPRGFDPLSRGEQLPAAVRARLAWLAGPELAALGYSGGGHDRAEAADAGRQRLADVRWEVLRAGRRIAAALLPDMRVKRARQDDGASASSPGVDGCGAQPHGGTDMVVAPSQSWLVRSRSAAPWRALRRRSPTSAHGGGGHPGRGQGG
jgi:hypothetical protein